MTTNKENILIPRGTPIAPPEVRRFTFTEALATEAKAEA